MNSRRMLVAPTFDQFRSIERFTERPLTGQIQINPAGAVVWLQRLLFQLMARLGATHPVERLPRVETFEVNFDDIARAVCECQADLMRVYGREAKYVVVGHDRFHQLVRARVTMPFMSFDWPTDYRAPVQIDGERVPYVFNGLKVLLVPWCRGLFLLPELP